jgi:hypothetical protein
MSETLPIFVYYPACLFALGAARLRAPNARKSTLHTVISDADAAHMRQAKAVPKFVSVSFDGSFVATARLASVPDASQNEAWTSVV